MPCQGWRIASSSLAGVTAFIGSGGLEFRFRPGACPVACLYWPGMTVAGVGVGVIALSGAAVVRAGNRLFRKPLLNFRGDQRAEQRMAIDRRVNAVIGERGSSLADAISTFQRGKIN